jgi:Asp-tRNA(Asn)/Glu-tRNA(Gln) amidotransferase A subunit family amidase
MRAPNLTTFTQWLEAPRSLRERALRSNLDLIGTLDVSIQAWVQVRPQHPCRDGVLSDIPYGAKDIIETRGLATEYGSSIYAGRVGGVDAAIVELLRDRGALLLGKTQSTPFAYYTPGPTRNPRDIRHTPGGSSSGSAAAVAAGMVPLAVGTQTRGSVLRPASYCGVTGFKPTYGLLSTEGVLPFARRLDTLGFFTHSPADMLAFWGAIGHAVEASGACAIGVVEPLPEVEPPMVAAFRAAVARLRSAGLELRPLDISGMLARLDTASNIVMSYEGARFHRERYNEHGSRLGQLADLVRAGLEMPESQYDEARGEIAACQLLVSEMYKATPIIASPAATGPAPFGLTSTGDSRMNAPWTALGTPAISIPLARPAGLPLGLQLTADRGEDAQLLRAAVRLHDLLDEPGVASSSGRAARGVGSRSHDGRRVTTANG